jgi:hypothetical protein
MKTCKHCKKTYKTGSLKDQCQKCYQLIKKYGSINPKKWEKRCEHCEVAFIHKGTRKYCDKCRYELKLRRNWKKNRIKNNISLDIPKKIKRKNGDGTVSHGYRYITKVGHPNAKYNGRILEHRYVMSKKINRPLKKNENVHHINGNTLDNRPENLELWHKGQPAGQRLEDKIEWAINFLEEYGYTITR